jgi:hypothetical protein
MTSYSRCAAASSRVGGADGGTLNNREPIALGKDRSGIGRILDKVDAETSAEGELARGRRDRDCVFGAIHSIYYKQVVHWEYGPVLKHVGRRKRRRVSG